MVRPLVDVRQGERRGAAAAFLTLFGILAAHTLLETARDALFLARLPVSQLPWVYMAMAVLAVGVSRSPWPSARGGRSALSLLLAASAVVTFLFWASGVLDRPWALRALYVWTGLLSTVTTLQFWLVLGDVYTVSQAKRLYNLVGVGSLLGAVCGAGAARVVADTLSPQHLVPVSAGVLLLTAVGPAFFLRRPGAADGPARRRSRDAPASLAEGVRLLRGHAYVRGVAGLVLISTVALTLADYVFKSAVARAVPAERLGSFLATFYMGLNVLALVVQVFVVGWALRALGLQRVLWALPALLFVGGAGVVFGGGLVAALLLKGADGTLRHSLHRTSVELMFVPLPDRARAVAKPLIDVAGQRGGQALASLLIVSQAGLGRGDVTLALATAALCVAWIAWATDLKRHYLELFRSALREGALPRAEMPELDLGSLETLFAGLNSQDDAEVVASIELLAEQGRERLIPALILYHPSRAVVLAALEQLAASGRSDFLPITGRLMQHDDAEVRAAALRARSVARPEPRVLHAALADPSPIVRAVALARLSVTDEAQGERARELRALAVRGSREERLGLAQALALSPDHRQADLLLALADDADDEILSQVARAMGRLHDARFLPALLNMLGRHEVRREARAALQAFGEPALDVLARALADRALPHELRRHLPRTISRFPPEAAVPILLGQLVEETDGMVRFKVLRGLNRIAAEHPDVTFDRQVVGEATERTIEAALRLLHWRSALGQGALESPARVTRGHQLLAELLRDKEVHAVERVFRLLALLHRDENFHQIYRGLRHHSPKVRAGSRELLENLLAPPLRGGVLALVDEAPEGLRLEQGRHYYRAEAIGYEELLGRILEAPGETLRSVAAYHVGELRLTSLRGRLEALGGPGAGFFVSRVVDRALDLLAEPAAGLA
jgi:hypothetical protein